MATIEVGDDQKASRAGPMRWTVGLAAFFSIVLAALIWLISPDWNATIKALLLVLGGGFGGLLYSLIQNDRKFVLASPSNTTKIEIGALSDILVGIGGAVALFGAAKWVGATTLASDPSRIQTVGVAILAGLSGKTILTALSQRLAEQVARAKATADEAKAGADEAKKIAEVKAKVAELIGRASSYFGKRDLREAERAFEEAKRLDPTSAAAFNGLAAVARERARSREDTDAGKKDLKTAVTLFTEAISKDGIYEKAKAYFNRACCGCLLGEDIKNWLPDLQEAIGLDPLNKALAINESREGDFQRVREKPKELEVFEKLVGEGS